MKNKRNIKLLLLTLFFIIPLTYDWNLLTINRLHFLLFTVVNIFVYFYIFLSKYKLNILLFNKYLFFYSTSFILIIIFIVLINGRFFINLEDILFIINLIIFAFFIENLFLDENKDDLISYSINILFITSTLISVIGLLQVSGIQILPLINKERPGSTLGITNFAVDYLAITFPFILFKLINLHINKKTVLLKLLFIFILLINLMYILSLRSRVVYIIIIINFFIALVFIYLSNFRQQRDFKTGIFNFLIIFGIVIASIAWGLKYSAIETDYKKDLEKLFLTTFRSDQNADRLGYWYSSLILFENNPVSGSGGNSWRGEYSAINSFDSPDNVYNGIKYNDENIYLNSEINPHNLYFEVLCEYGVFGFIFLSLFLFFPLYNILTERKLIVNLFVFFIVYFNFIILSFFTFTRINVSLMIVFIFITVIIYNLKENTRKINFKGNFKKAAAVFIIFIIIISTVYGFTKYLSEKNYISAMKNKSKSDYVNMMLDLGKMNSMIYPADPNLMPIDYYRGIGNYELKNYKEAKKNFLKAKELIKYDPLIMSNLASTYYMEGNSDSAKIILNEVLKYFPNYIEPQINLLAIYYNNKDFESAKNLIKDISTKEKDTTKIRNYNVYQSIKNYFK
jgi:O-antigen ligase